MSCSDGKYATVGSTVCTKCTIGRYGENCTKCEEGKYRDDTMREDAFVGSAQPVSQKKDGSVQCIPW